MDDIYIIVFGIMLIFIIFAIIFGVIKEQREREKQIETKIRNVYEFLDKKKRYFIMEPYCSDYKSGLWESRTYHKYTEVDGNDELYVGLQKVNYIDILQSKTYLKVSHLGVDFNIRTEYFLYDKKKKEKE